MRAIRETPVPKPTARITEMGAAAEALALQRGTDAGQLKRDLSGDLDCIVMKAIEKDRHFRYASASEFAADIERYLRSEPVLAGPPGAAYRIRKFAVRHHRPVAAAAAVVLALIAGIITTTWQGRVAGQQRTAAIGERAEAEKQRGQAERQAIEAAKQRDAAQAAERSGLNRRANRHDGAGPGRCRRRPGAAGAECSPVGETAGRHRGGHRHGGERLSAERPIQDIRVHPTLGDRVFVLTNSNGGYLWTSTDAGQTWKNPGAGWPANLTPWGVFVAASPSQLVYVQIGGQLRRSSDGGVTFDAGIETPCDSFFEASPADPRRLACTNSTSRYFYFSTDEGRNWTRGAAAPVQGTAGCELVNDFRNPLIYLGYCFDATPVGQFDRYFRSTDGLQSTFPSTPPPHFFNRFFASPDRSLILSQGTGNVISRSRDMGQTWEPFGPTGTSFGFDPVDANIVYRDGKSRSTDGGRTYTDIAGRGYVPVLSSVAPVELTLESGSSYDPQVLVRDPSGSEFLLSSFAPAIPTTAPWVQYRDSYYYVVSSAGLASGSYETSLGLALGNFSVGQIAVKLQVVPRRDPPVFLRSNRIAGNGVYREDSGLAGPWPGDNGPATSAPLPVVSAMTSDSGGNLYLAFDSRVQRVASDGIVRNFAGTGAFGNTGDGGPAARATFQGIDDLLKVNEGILILDGSARRISLVRPDGTIEAFYTPPAGNPIALGFSSKLAADSAGTVFISTNTGVYRWQGGGVWTLVFNHSAIAPGASSLLSGFATFSSFAIDRRDNSILLGYVDRIVRRSTSGQVTVLLGTPGKTGFSGDGNNTASGSLTENPRSLAIDSRGAIYFGEHNRVRVILPTGVMGTVAGNGAFDNPPADNAFAIGGGLRRIGVVHVRPNDELAVYSSLSYIFRMVAVAAPTSAIDPGGVVTLAGKARIAPGAIFSIYGRQLADGVVDSAAPPLKNKLGNTSVQVNGIDIPLFYVSPGQINAQMPYNVPLGTARVRVTLNAVVTSEENVTILAASPDVIPYGAQRAVAVNQNGSVNGPGTPAPAGSVVVLYLTGIGAVTPALTAGQAAPGDPLSQATLPYKLTLSNGSTTADATVIFLGHTPTYAGLVQANFQVPNVPAGDYTLTLTVGGEPSNTTKFAVGP